MKKLLFTLFCLLSINLAYSATEDVYLLAQTKNVTELQNVKNIDITDKNGDTALCSAIKDGNIDAYNLLKNAGASVDHKCVKKIPTEQYEHFITKVATTNNSWSFLGLGKWAWVGIGAGVAGGAVAAGMGGGGGSGGSSGGDSSSSSNGGHTYTPHFNEWLQEGYQYEPCQNGYHQIAQVYDWSGEPGNSEKIYMYKCETNHCEYNTTECTDGYIETGETCQSGDVVYKKCIPQTCPSNYRVDCSEGFHATSNTCQNGEYTLVECEINSCEGYDFLQCSEGYTINDSCMSGYTTKYKCDIVQCPYNTTECSEGFHASGNTCKSGENIFTECVPNTCEGYQYYCQDGYTEVPGDTCNSGGNILKKCEPNSCDGYDFTQCPSGYSTSDTCNTAGIIKRKCTANSCYGYDITDASQCSGGWTVDSSCQSGETMKYKCKKIQCGSNATWTEEGCACNDGYENWVAGTGCSLKILNCGDNAYQSGTQCICNPGYQNPVIGVGCSLIPLECGTNAHQENTNCVCNTGYTFWTQGVGCYEKRDCGVKSYYDGTKCVCEPGYMNWQQGVGCSLYGEIATESDYNQNINLNNEGDNIVYGIFSEGTSLTNSYSYMDSATSVYEQGIINITNEGDGNVYGMYTDNDNSITNSIANISGDTVVPLNYPTNYTIYSQSNGYITLNNTGSGDVYGIFGMKDVYNSKAIGDLVDNYTSNSKRPYYQIAAVGEVGITNEGNGDVFGLYNGIANAYTVLGNNEIYGNMQKIARGRIRINNTGSGDVYGIFGDGANALSNIPLNSGTSGSIDYSYSTHGIIDITNTGDGNVYGIYGNGKNVDSQSSSANGDITITNTGDGNVYGIYGNGKNVSNKGKGKITIINTGNGYTYGIKGTNIAHNSPLTVDAGTGEIYIENLRSGNAFGLFANQVYNGNDSSISILNLSNGLVCGMYGTDIDNIGEISINNLSTGSAFGIFGTENSNIVNSGNITIFRNAHLDNGTYYGGKPEGTAGDVFGIYAKAGSTVYNSGTIDITTNGNVYGIYVESGSSVSNTGTIKISANNYNINCSGSYCSGFSKAIVLNGSTLYNSGVVRADALSFAPMRGNVVARAGSSFVVDNDISGDLHIDSDVVTSGNKTTYIAENMIDAGDTSGLNLISDSAMFDASLSGKDVVMQMKDFDTLTDNKSLAAFLKNNYDKGNGSELFSALKSMDNMSAFNGALSGFTGLNTFTQFAHEDLSAMREISFSMNNKLFENSNRDSFDISDSMGYFSFSNRSNGGNGQYGISSEKMSENWKLGYGMAMANIYTNDGDGLSRQNKMWLFYMPATYTDDNIELVIAPKAGFTHSEYNRRGYNNQNYEGYIEKRIFGMMNDLRYPLTLGNWTFAPDLAFNTIVYTQDGHEDEHEFSLVIPHDNIVSVETGLGLYSKYEKQFQNGSRLKFTSGIMWYREYGDTYNIKLGMRGMDGTFDLYNNDYKYRAALNFGLDYTVGNLHMYGNTQYFMDNDNYMNFKGGVSYRF